MEEIARVYADALFRAAKEGGKLDAIHEQLGQLADALAESREMQVFFFSPYFSSTEKRDGMHQGDRRAPSPSWSTSSSCSTRSTGCPCCSGSGAGSTISGPKENKRLR